MATNVILPALGMSQETGKIVRWLKTEGAQVTKGEPIVEIETDKATVELEAAASGTLSTITAADGEDVPVGHTIAVILAANEVVAKTNTSQAQTPVAAQAPLPAQVLSPAPTTTAGNGTFVVSPLASRIAAEHNLDLSQITPTGKRIQKSDVLSYLQEQQKGDPTPGISTIGNTQDNKARLIAASPKARRLAAEQGKNLALIHGTGQDGAILTADVLAAAQTISSPTTLPLVQAEAELEATPAIAGGNTNNGATQQAVSTIWRIMAERTTHSWTSVPHFSLVREVNVSRLITWREQLLKRNKSGEKITYTDLLVKAVASVLGEYPRINASWNNGSIALNSHINVGIAVAADDGLIVPVIHDADQITIAEIARRRKEVVNRTQAGKIRPEDIQGNTFTISNLGMYGVDAFNAIINAPNAAILAVGRIAERVVPVDGQPKVQPMMVLTLSCDHRVIDGARGAQFLSTLADVIEEPLGLIG